MLLNHEKQITYLVILLYNNFEHFVSQDIIFWALFCRPAQAVAFAAVSGVAGLTTLYFGVNELTAALGAANLVIYTLIYTPMKRISILNTWVGSVGMC